MALKIVHREKDGVAVLALSGGIVFGEEINALREKVKSLLGEGKKNIVLNLCDVTVIDSKGLGALVAVYHSAKLGGASLRLCKLGSRCNELLQVSKLDTVLDVSHTEEDAVRDMVKEASAD